MSGEWKESKATRAPGNVWNYQRGYRVKEAGRHENEREYNAFQFYLNQEKSTRNIQKVSEEMGLSISTITSYYYRFNWDKRVIAWDTAQTALVWKENNKLKRNQHKKDILAFRESQERHARLMAEVSEKLFSVLLKRIKKAEKNQEDIPLQMVSNFLKAAASVSEQSRQSWGTSLGVNEMIEAVENEIERVDIMDVSEEDPYNIPIEE